MRRVAMLILTVTFSLGLADLGIAGPFDLSMGMKRAEFTGKLEKMEAPGRYITKEVPKPHSSFDVYGLLFGPKTGLCSIVAVGQTVQTSVYGTELRRNFDNLEKRLKDQYGENKRFDYLREGSIWNEPKDFMNGLLKQERFLSAQWRAEEGSRLRDHLQAIFIKATAHSSEEGSTTVKYEFENYDECKKELETAEDDAL